MKIEPWILLAADTLKLWAFRLVKPLVRSLTFATNHRRGEALKKFPDTESVFPVLSCKISHFESKDISSKVPSDCG